MLYFGDAQWNDQGLFLTLIVTSCLSVPCVLLYYYIAVVRVGRASQLVIASGAYVDVDGDVGDGDADASANNSSSRNGDGSALDSSTTTTTATTTAAGGGGGQRRRRMLFTARNSDYLPLARLFRPNHVVTVATASATVGNSSSSDGGDGGKDPSHQPPTTALLLANGGTASASAAVSGGGPPIPLSYLRPETRASSFYSPMLSELWGVLFPSSSSSTSTLTSRLHRRKRKPASVFSILSRHLLGIGTEDAAYADDREAAFFDDENCNSNGIDEEGDTVKSTRGSSIKPSGADSVATAAAAATDAPPCVVGPQRRGRGLFRAFPFARQLSTVFSSSSSSSSSSSVVAADDVPLHTDPLIEGMLLMAKLGALLFMGLPIFSTLMVLVAAGTDDYLSGGSNSGNNNGGSRAGGSDGMSGRNGSDSSSSSSSSSSYVASRDPSNCRGKNHYEYRRVDDGGGSGGDGNHGIVTTTTTTAAASVIDDGNETFTAFSSSSAMLTTATSTPFSSSVAPLGVGGYYASIPNPTTSQTDCLRSPFCSWSLLSGSTTDRNSSSNGDNGGGVTSATAMAVTTPFSSSTSGDPNNGNSNSSNDTFYFDYYACVPVDVPGLYYLTILNIDPTDSARNFILILSSYLYAIGFVSILVMSARFVTVYSRRVMRLQSRNALGYRTVLLRGIPTEYVTSRAAFRQAYLSMGGLVDWNDDDDDDGENADGENADGSTGGDNRRRRRSRNLEEIFNYFHGNNNQTSSLSSSSSPSSNAAALLLCRNLCITLPTAGHLAQVRSERRQRRIAAVRDAVNRASEGICLGGGGGGVDTVALLLSHNQEQEDPSTVGGGKKKKTPKRKSSSNGTAAHSNKNNRRCHDNNNAAEGIDMDSLCNDDGEEEGDGGARNGGDQQRGKRNGDEDDDGESLSASDVYDNHHHHHRHLTASSLSFSSDTLFDMLSYIAAPWRNMWSFIVSLLMTSSCCCCGGGGGGGGGARNNRRIPIANTILFEGLFGGEGEGSTNNHHHTANGTTTTSTITNNSNTATTSYSTNSCNNSNSKSSALLPPPLLLPSVENFYIREVQPKGYLRAKARYDNALTALEEVVVAENRFHRALLKERRKKREAAINHTLRRKKKNAENDINSSSATTSVVDVDEEEAGDVDASSLLPLPRLQKLLLFPMGYTSHQLQQQQQQKQQQDETANLKKSSCFSSIRSHIFPRYVPAVEYFEQNVQKSAADLNAVLSQNKRHRFYRSHSGKDWRGKFGGGVSTTERKYTSFRVRDEDVASASASSAAVSDAAVVGDDTTTTTAVASSPPAAAARGRHSHRHNHKRTSSSASSSASPVSPRAAADLLLLDQTYSGMLLTDNEDDDDEEDADDGDATGTGRRSDEGVHGSGATRRSHHHHSSPKTRNSNTPHSNTSNSKGIIVQPNGAVFVIFKNAAAAKEYVDLFNYRFGSYVGQVNRVRNGIQQSTFNDNGNAQSSSSVVADAVDDTNGKKRKGTGTSTAGKQMYPNFSQLYFSQQIATIAGPPQEVNRTALSISQFRGKFIFFCFLLLLIVLMIIWTVPVALLANFEAIAALAPLNSMVRRSIADLPDVFKSLLQSWLPVFLVTIFRFVLNVVIEKAMKFSGSPNASHTEGWKICLTTVFFFTTSVILQSAVQGSLALLNFDSFVAKYFSYVAPGYGSSNAGNRNGFEAFLDTIRQLIVSSITPQGGYWYATAVLGVVTACMEPIMVGALVLSGSLASRVTSQSQYDSLYKRNYPPLVREYSSILVLMGMGALFHTTTPLLCIFVGFTLFMVYFSAKGSFLDIYLPLIDSTTQKVTSFMVVKFAFRAVVVCYLFSAVGLTLGLSSSAALNGVGGGGGGGSSSSSPAGTDGGATATAANDDDDTISTVRIVATAFSVVKDLLALLLAIFIFYESSKWDAPTVDDMHDWHITAPPPSSSPPSSSVLPPPPTAEEGKHQPPPSSSLLLQQQQEQQQQLCPSAALASAANNAYYDEERSAEALRALLLAGLYEGVDYHHQQQETTSSSAVSNAHQTALSNVARIKGNTGGEGNLRSSNSISGRGRGGGAIVRRVEDIRLQIVLQQSDRMEEVVARAAAMAAVAAQQSSGEGERGEGGGSDDEEEEDNNAVGTRKAARGVRGAAAGGLLDSDDDDASSSFGGGGGGGGGLLLASSSVGDYTPVVLGEQHQHQEKNGLRIGGTSPSSSVPLGKSPSGIVGSSLFVGGEADGGADNLLLALSVRRAPSMMHLLKQNAIFGGGSSPAPDAAQTPAVLMETKEDAEEKKRTAMGGTAEKRDKKGIDGVDAEAGSVNHSVKATAAAATNPLTSAPTPSAPATSSLDHVSLILRRSLAVSITPKPTADCLDRPRDYASSHTTTRGLLFVNAEASIHAIHQKYKGGSGGSNSASLNTVAAGIGREDNTDPSSNTTRSAADADDALRSSLSPDTHLIARHWHGDYLVNEETALSPWKRRFIALLILLQPLTLAKLVFLP